MNRRGILTTLGAFLIAMLTGSGSFAQSGAPERNQRIEQQRQQQREQLEQAVREEGSILEELEAIDRSVLEQESSLEQLRVRQEEVEKRLGGLELERRDLESGMEKRRGQLKKRLRALYKYSTKGFMQAVFASGSSTDMMKRTKYLQLIVRRDMELIRQQRQALDRFGQVRQTMEQERLQVDALRTETGERVALAQEERGKKRSLLQRIRQERSVADRKLKELDAAAAALNRRLENLPTGPVTAASPAASAAASAAGATAVTAVTIPKPAPARTETPPDQTKSQLSNTTVAEVAEEIRQAGTFVGQKGRLVYPLDGARISKAYGKYREPGMKAYDFHRGLDIDAAPGTPFRAIYGGEVKLAEWFKGYGLLMIIDHGSGYHSIYAHASRHLKKAGDVVRSGEKVGLVGDTGSFQGPYLYLEIREKGKAVNPLEWLKIPPGALALETPPAGGEP